MRNSIRNNSGLTLIEVLLAVVIIAVAFLALSASQLTSLRVTRSAELSSVATQFANETLEVLIQRVLDDYTGYQACPGAAGCTGTETRDNFTATFDIRRGSGYVAEGLVRIDINVTGPAEAELHHFVSCMDNSPPPTVRDPGMCY